MSEQDKIKSVAAQNLVKHKDWMVISFHHDPLHPVVLTNGIENPTQWRMAMEEVHKKHIKHTGARVY